MNRRTLLEVAAIGPGAGALAYAWALKALRVRLTAPARATPAERDEGFVALAAVAATALPFTNESPPQPRRARRRR